MWPWKKRTRPEPETTRVLSLLTPEEVDALGGLPSEALAGVFDSDELTVGGFRPNPKFVSFLHEVLATRGPLEAGLQKSAQTQQEGWLYVIDLRTPDGPQGRVPPEDIVGAFEVQNGGIVEGSYQPMETHQIYTGDGLVVLPEGLRRAFVDELHQRRG
jgi:hypothetical protein